MWISKSKAQIIKDEIVELKGQIAQKTLEMKECCRHTKVTHDNYCSDDWAMPKEYTDTYTCDVCGLCASCQSPPSIQYQPYEVDWKFETLYKKYWKDNKSKLETFQYKYTVK